MSLRRSLLASYLGQGYTAVIGLAVLPLYVHYMGAEAFGLVGFFAMAQAWALLLDFGLTAAVTRELSRFRAGAVGKAEIAAIVRAIELGFAGLGLTAAVVIAASADWVARDWLRPGALSRDELVGAVAVMGMTIGTRWLTSFYRGALAALERLVLLNSISVLVATVRWLGALAVLIAWSARPTLFFGYQALVAFLEMGAFAFFYYRSFPALPRVRANFRGLRALTKMAGSMALLAALWLVSNQADRLILSGIVDLEHYGYFTVAVTLAGAITLLSGPLSQTLQPRFSVLAAKGDTAVLFGLYRVSTQVTAAALGAVAGVMACFPGPLLWAWTGSAATAQACAPMVPLYALGNAIAALLGLAFLVQFALGRLRPHVIGNCLFAALWIPGLYVAAREAGAVGAGAVWFAGNLAYLLLWLPYVHQRLSPGLAWIWLRDVGGIVLAEALLLGILRHMDLGNSGRVRVAAVLILMTLGLALAGLFAGSATRAGLQKVLRSLLAAKPA